MVTLALLGLTPLKCLSPGGLTVDMLLLDSDEVKPLCSFLVFQPIAIETSGAFGSSAIDFINDLDRRRMRSVSQDTRAGTFLMQRLSVAMQRGNAACILGTIADDDVSTEFFV